MHLILKVKQILIENLFIECDYYFFKSSRRAGLLLVELKYGFISMKSYLCIICPCITFIVCIFHERF